MRALHALADTPLRPHRSRSSHPPAPRRPPAELGNWAVNKAKTSLAKVTTAVASVMPAMVPTQKRKIYKTELFMSMLFLVAAFFAIFIHAKWAYVRPACGRCRCLPA